LPDFFVVPAGGAEGASLADVGSGSFLSFNLRFIFVVGLGGCEIVAKSASAVEIFQSLYSSFSDPDCASGVKRPNVRYR
jgi:hypothetical protein